MLCRLYAPERNRGNEARQIREEMYRCTVYTNQNKTTRTRLDSTEKVKRDEVAWLGVETESEEEE